MGARMEIRMDDRKICFIMCTNNSLYEEECLYYINQLHVPAGYQIEKIAVHDAVSMTSGYNEAMQRSEAKYKIYLHQDVFIIYPDFLAAILHIFENREIGMIGMVGNLDFDQYAIMWKGKRVGMLHSNSIFFANSYLFGEVLGDYKEVSAIDGLMMITQYDIKWRSDQFKNWDFYDASQSREFAKKGYKVVVPRMLSPWCIHDDGILNMDNYYKERQIYIDEYRTEMR